MRRALLIGPKEIKIEEIATPTPGPGEVLLKIECALSEDAVKLSCLTQEDYPYALSSEFAGTVAAVGEGVSSFKAGDAVVCAHSAGCGECPQCLDGEPFFCDEYQKNAVRGGLADYILLNAALIKRAAFLKPASLPFEKAVFLEPLACALHSLKSAELFESDCVLILGANVPGLLHLAALKATCKVGKIIVADTNDERLRMAGKAGASLVVNYAKQNLLECVKTATFDYGVQVVYECSGTPTAQREMFDTVSRGSHIVVFGGYRGGVPTMVDTGRVHYDQIMISGSCGCNREDLQQALKLLSSGQVDPTPLLSGTFTLDKTEAIAKLTDQGLGLKYQLVP